MKLRHYLLGLFLFLTVTPLLLFRAWPYTEVVNNEVQEVHERHLLLARNLGTALERYHRDLVTTFDLLLGAPETWSDAGSISAVLANLNFRHLCMADWDTGQITNALAPASAPCPKTVPDANFARLKTLAAPDQVTFGPVVETADGALVIHMVKRLNGQLAIGAVNTTYFRELGKAISFGKRGHAAIVDQTGRALAHPLDSWVAERRDLSKVSPVRRMMNGETGVETFYSPALKGDMIAGFTHVAPVGWGVMIPQPLEELYQNARDARRSSFAVLLIGICSALALALMISYRVVRPLEQITLASSSIAGGILELPRLSGSSRLLPVEFRELHMRFREMVLRLRENLSTINALAYQDAVTGLGNRSYLFRRLEAALEAGQNGTLILIDLDGFKAVNDLYGHDIGDMVLEEVGKRLCAEFKVKRLADAEKNRFYQVRANAPRKAVVTRFGGDEFAIWVPRRTGQDVAALTGKIVGRLAEPIVIGDKQATIGASIGFASHPEHGTDRSSLMKCADLALYDAKQSGKNRFVAYSPELLAAVETRRKLRQDIRAGLEQGQFLPYFQPQFRLRDRKITGVEALVRWDHPERGLLPPVEFLEAAREINLLGQIDAQMQNRSIALIRELTDQGSEIGSLAVNLSEQRLSAPDFLDTLDRLDDLPFELRFELVETMVLDRIDGRLAWTLDRIREYGHSVDLDDFGAANASVLALMSIEPSHIKIDRNLVSGMAPGNVPERLVRSIIGMGQSLGIPTIAEGADSEARIASLDEMGCDYAQGFALAHPMSAADLSDLLCRQKATNADLALVASR